MFIKKIVIPRGATNCYLYGQREGKGIVIDPGGSPKKIAKLIDQSGMEISKIINTHGHFDHIGANQYIKEKTEADLVIHQADRQFLTDSSKNLSLHLGSEVTSPPADQVVEDGDIIKVGELELEVIHTPGHSPGGISLYNRSDNILFSGDTIFKSGIGRSDFPTADQKLLYQSIEEKLLSLSEDTRIYPGHGQETTIGNFIKIWKQIRS